MKRFTRDVAIIAAATAVSRVFGLFRDVVIADKFGAGRAYDAYLIAFFVPHFLRRLLAEGALALSFIPIYTDYLQNDPAEARKLASNAFNLSLIAFPVVVVVGIGLAPYYIPFLASGFSPSQLELTVELTRVIFPFIGIIGLAALVMGILKSKKSFFPPAFAPVFFNVGVILGALFLGRFFSRPIFGLAIGVLIGGLGQLGFQLPYLKKAGFSWKPNFLPVHPGLKKAVRLMAPVVIGLVAMQVNVMVDNKLASHLVPGSVSSLQYATRLYQLPLGLFAIAISTAILPRLSGLWAEDSRKAFADMLDRGVKFSLLIVVPAGAGLFLLGEPIVELLFEHRSFLPSDTARTVHVLNFYLVGLIGYSFVTLFSRAFYSVKDTVTPVVVSLLAVGVNVGLDLALVEPMEAGGLALATGVSGVVNGGLLMAVFGFKTGLEGFLPDWRFVLKVAVSAALMGIVVYALREYSPVRGNFFLVPAGVIFGAGSYFGAGMLFGLKDTFVEELTGPG
ncbi:MAG: murein biosynthesis integral membrane protein MurJ, partial [Candidatus Bipolaricaulota bacterium]